MRHRFRPTCEPVEPRTLPSLTLLALIDTGYGAAGAPRPPWVEAGVNFLGPVATSNDYDTMGVGGHGTAMGDLYAQTLAHFGVQAHVVPLVACGPTTGPLAQFVPVSYTSQAIGEAELWVAQEQARMRAEGRDVQWIVALPAQPHPVGLTEFWGRRALDAAGVPIIQAAGNGGWFGSPLFFDHSPTALVAQDASAITGPEAAALGSFVTFAAVPPGYGSSGATMVTAAYLTADIYAHPSWPAAWWVYDVHARRVLT